MNKIFKDQKCCKHENKIASLKVFSIIAIVLFMCTIIVLFILFIYMPSLAEKNKKKEQKEKFRMDDLDFESGIDLD